MRISLWRLAASSVLLLSLLAACGRSKPEVLPLAQAPAICQVTRARKISSGGDQSWGGPNLLAFEEHDNHGVFQLWTMRPDGSRRTCLSCQARPDEPTVDRNKYFPTWRPQGDWIVVQVELAKHPLNFMHTSALLSVPLHNGVWNDLYAVTPDGAHWVRLTDTTAGKIDGAFSAAFSPDGKQLMWSRIVQRGGSSHPWGVWQLLLADFQLVGGTPQLANVRDITPTGTKFIEAHVFSPDGGSVLVASDHDSTSMWQMDIWHIDLATGQATNLTKHNGAWNEHAIYTPDGQHIIFMTTRLYPNAALQSDLVMVDLDGSNWRRLTSFNLKGSQEYAGHKVMPIHTRWDPNGNQLSVTLQSGDHYPERDMWIVSFAGPCGRTN